MSITERYAVAVLLASLSACYPGGTETRTALGRVDRPAGPGGRIRVVLFGETLAVAPVGADARFQIPLPVQEAFEWYFELDGGQVQARLLTGPNLICEAGPPFDSGDWLTRACPVDNTRCAEAQQALAACGDADCRTETHVVDVLCARIEPCGGPVLAPRASSDTGCMEDVE